MFDLDNFGEATLSKLTDVSGGHILDLYISDSMQDMLDIDIKSEVATVVGGASEFHTLMNFDLPSLDYDPNSSYNEDDDDAESSHSEESHSHNRSATSTSTTGSSKRGTTTTAKKPTLPKWTERSSFRSASSIVDYLESPITNMPSNASGFIMSQCVNPNSVMPGSAAAAAASGNSSFSKVLKNYTKSNAGQGSANVRRTNNGYNTNLNEISVNQTNSPCEKKSHLNFSPMRFSSIGKQPQPQHLFQTQVSANAVNDLQIKVEPEEEVIVALQEDPQQRVNMIRKNLANDMLMMNGGQKARSASPVVHHNRDSSSAAGHRIELAFGGLNGLSYSRASSQSPLTVGSHGGRESGNSARYPKVSTPQSHHHGTRTVSGRGGSSSTASSPSLYHQMSTKSSKSKLKLSPNDFPKPAYSYSCLIAMALKNSRSGSLPVSEIYNFMCEHFPYFKTAPNGWKNSVRHNLSLNKCFDKIEKPATNGGQRKGCLWAMNPSKVLKMDEEVQKWSRKDPMAIRRAMVHPENLAALERGELKHGNFGDEDDYPEDDEDEEGGNPEDYAPEEEEDPEDQEIDVGGGAGHTITTMAGRKVYRRPVMLSDEFGMEDDMDDEDYEVRSKKRRRGSASSSNSMRSDSRGKVYQGNVSRQSLSSPLHQQQHQQRSRSRSNSPSVKMVLKQQQQRRLLMATASANGHGSPGLMRVHQIKQEALDTEESEEDEQEGLLEDEDIFPRRMKGSHSAGSSSSRDLSDEAMTDEDVKDGNQMMHLSTLIGEQADHLIASGNFDIEAADFYDEIEIDDFEFDRKDLKGLSAYDGFDNCHMDQLVAAKRQRLDGGYGMQKVQQPMNGGNRRKMPLVNRIL